MKVKNTLLQAVLLLVFFIGFLCFEIFLRRIDLVEYGPYFFFYGVPLIETLPLSLILSIEHLKSLKPKGKFKLNVPFMVMAVLLIWGFIPNTTLHTFILLHTQVRFVFWLIFWYCLFHMIEKEPQATIPSQKFE